MSPTRRSASGSAPASGVQAAPVRRQDQTVERRASATRRRKCADTTADVEHRLVGLQFDAAQRRLVSGSLLILAERAQFTRQAHPQRPPPLRASAEVECLDGLVHTNERVAELSQRIGEDQRPDDIPATEMLLLHDPQAGSALAILLFDSEDDYRKGNQALNAMPADETPGGPRIGRQVPGRHPHDRYDRLNQARAISRRNSFSSS